MQTVKTDHSQHPGYQFRSAARVDVSSVLSEKDRNGQQQAQKNTRFHQLPHQIGVPECFFEQARGGDAINRSSLLPQDPDSKRQQPFRHPLHDFAARETGEVGPAEQQSEHSFVQLFKPALALVIGPLKEQSFFNSG